LQVFPTQITGLAVQQPQPIILDLDASSTERVDNGFQVLGSCAHRIAAAPLAACRW
jgi:hypothetical protein